MSTPLRYRGIDFTPTEEVARYAEEGLRLRREWKRGGTAIGIARGRDLKRRRTVSPNTIKRMVSFFARHEVDKRGRNFGNPHKPSNGFIAWMLWGGDAGKKWANDIRDRMRVIDGDTKKPRRLDVAVVEDQCESSSPR